MMEMVVLLLLKLFTGVFHGCDFHEELNHINTYRRIYLPCLIVNPSFCLYTNV
jgi:hypothetical protein